MKKKHSKCGCKKSKKTKKPVKKKKPRIKKLLVITPKRLTVGRNRKKK